MSGRMRKVDEGVKQVLSKGGQDIKLSIPTVISGEDYTVNSLSDVDCVVIPFKIGDDRRTVQKARLGLGG